MTARERLANAPLYRLHLWMRAAFTREPGTTKAYRLHVHRCGKGVSSRLPAPRWKALLCAELAARLLAPPPWDR